MSYSSDTMSKRENSSRPQCSRDIETIARTHDNCMLCCNLWARFQSRSRWRVCVNNTSYPVSKSRLDPYHQLFLSWRSFDEREQKVARLQTTDKRNLLMCMATLSACAISTTNGLLNALRSDVYACAGCNLWMYNGDNVKKRTRGSNVPL